VQANETRKGITRFMRITLTNVIMKVKFNSGCGARQKETKTVEIPE
jgi:hypothetical protein